MEPAAVVGELQIHVGVQLCKRVSAYVAEELGQHVSAEVGKQSVDRDEVYPERLSASNELHLLDPRNNKLLESKPLILV